MLYDSARVELVDWDSCGYNVNMNENYDTIVLWNYFRWVKSNLDYCGRHLRPVIELYKTWILIYISRNLLHQFRSGPKLPTYRSILSSVNCFLCYHSYFSNLLQKFHESLSGSVSTELRLRTILCPQSKFHQQNMSPRQWRLSHYPLSSNRRRTHITCIRNPVLVVSSSAHISMISHRRSGRALFCYCWLQQNNHGRDIVIGLGRHFSVHPHSKTRHDVWFVNQVKH